MVIVIALIQHRSYLALGNIVGSAISNILAAFSLGLLFQRESVVTYDRSSRIYTLLLLALTAVVVISISFDIPSLLARKLVGSAFVAIFGIYLVSIASLIYRGIVTAPEDSDSDSDTNESADEAESEPANEDANFSPRSTSRFTPTTPLLQSSQQPISSCTSPHSRFPLPFYRPLLSTVFNFLLLTLSAYTLTTSSSTIVHALHMSDALFGIVLLSLATTLPEKFVAAIGARKGSTGIVIASTVGSNIFLLSLAVGIWYLGSDRGEMLGMSTADRVEAGLLLFATVWLAAIIWAGSLTKGWARGVGFCMLAVYIAFIAIEFAVLRR